MRISCEQTILMKYHALFIIFEKTAKFLNCRLLQIIGGALRVNIIIALVRWMTICYEWERSEHGFILCNMSIFVYYVVVVIIIITIIIIKT